MKKKNTTSVLPYKKALNFVIFLLLFVSASFLALVMKVNLMTYNIMVLLPPVIFLLVLNHKQQKKTIILEGLFIGVVGELLFDRFAHSSKAWYLPSMFEFRPLGLPVENLVWSILYAMMAFAFYEYFFDTQKSKKLNPFHKKWITFGIGVIVVIPLLYLTFPHLFIIPYFYLFLVIFFIICDFFIFYKYPKVATKALIASVVVIPLGFIHEFVSLELKHWIFEFGNHIGYLNLFGYLIPYEELVFYVVVPMALMAFYELVVDNKKA